MSIKLSLLILFTIFTNFAMCQDSLSSNNEIKLRFVDEGTGSRVIPENIEIMNKLNPKSNYVITKTQIASNGTVTMKLPNGNYNFIVNSKDYKQMATDFSPFNESLKINFNLIPINQVKELSVSNIRSLHQKNGQVIVGFIIDELTGLPINNVLVYSQDKVQETKTNDKGYFQIVLPLPINKNSINGRSTLIFTKPNYKKEVRTNFDMTPMGDLILQIRMNVGTGVNKEKILMKREPIISISTKITNDNSGSEKDNYQLLNINATCHSGIVKVGSGCSCHSCSSWINVLDAETYVRQSLSQEWFESWGNWPSVSNPLGMNSLKAGSVAIRSVLMHRIDNPSVHGNNFNICDNTCCQVWANSQYTNCIIAANNTANNILVNTATGNTVKAEFAHETNDNYPGIPQTSGNYWGQCGDGKFQKSVSGPPINGGGCYPASGTDPVCIGKPYDPASHPRGMCQIGSARWATGLTVPNNSNQGTPHSFGTKDWTQLLAYYYPSYYTLTTCSGGCSPSSSNDLCGNAIILTPNSNCNYITGTTCGASPISPSTNIPTCIISPSIANDVWYKFTATQSTAIVNVQSGSNFDAIVQVLSQVVCASSYTQIQCSNSTGLQGLETLSLTGLTIGNTYWIRVYNNSGATGSDFQICITTSTTLLPDLTITAGSQSAVPSTISAGSNTTIACSENNSGFANASANIVKIYLSTDNVLTPGTNGDTYIDFINFPSVNANSNSIVNSKSIIIPSNTPSGNYYLFFWADGGEIVAETDNSNNFASVQITVTGSTQTYTISTSSNPSGGGTTSGSGNYSLNQQITLTATNNSGYTFVNWTESGNIITTNASYTFNVTANRNLVANFTNCSYTLDHYSTTSIAAGGTGAFWVNTSSNCPWTATTSGCSGMITLINSSGIGSTLINYNLSANTSTSPRSCTITVNNLIFTVNQVGYVAPCANPPLAPNNLTVGVSNSNVLYLSWNGNNTGVTDFQIEKSLSASGPFSVIGSSGNYFGYADSNVIGGTTYYYRVRACCNSNCSNYSNTASLEACTYSTKPTGVIPNTLTICQGNSVTLTVQGGYVGTGAVMTWRSNQCNSGPIVGTGQSITVTPNTNTVYVVKPEGGNCQITLSCAVAFIYVNSLPSASLISANGATNFCSGGSVTLSGNNGGTWNNGATTPSIIVNSSGDYFVTNTNTCGSTQSNHILVNVNNPIVNAGVDQFFCNGNPVSLGTTQISGNSYSWLPTTGLNDSQSATPNASPNITTNYTLTITDVNGCVASDQVTVTVNTFSDTVGICPGSNITFYSGSSSIGNVYQWQVYDVSGFINLSNSAIYFGSNSDTLKIISPPSSWYNKNYRCVITNNAITSYSLIYKLKFAVTWTGAVNSAWENTANWCCGILPDDFTDVYISTGYSHYPDINSNAICRSIKAMQNTSVNISPGYKLDIKGN